jgi:hypothetical protein
MAIMPLSSQFKLSLDRPLVKYYNETSIINGCGTFEQLVRLCSMVEYLNREIKKSWLKSSQNCLDTGLAE